MTKRPAVIRTKTNGSTIVTNSTLIPIYGSKSTSPSISSYDIQIGNTQIFPMAGEMAKNFDKVKFLSLQFRIQPVMATTVSGNTAIYFDSDRRDPGPESLSQAMTSKNCKVSPIWDRSTFRCTNAMIRPNEMFATDVPIAGTAGVPDTDNSFPSPGRVHIFVSEIFGATFTTNTVLCNLVIDYSVELINPTHATSGAVPPKRFISDVPRDVRSVSYTPAHISAWEYFSSGCRYPPNFFQFLSYIKEDGTLNENLAIRHEPVVDNPFELRFASRVRTDDISVPLLASKVRQLFVPLTDEVGSSRAFTKSVPSDVRIYTETYDPSKVTDTEPCLRLANPQSGGLVANYGWGCLNSTIYTNNSAGAYLMFECKNYNNREPLIPESDGQGFYSGSYYLSSAERKLLGAMEDANIAVAVQGTPDGRTQPVGSKFYLYYTPIAARKMLWTRAMQKCQALIGGVLTTQAYVTYLIAPDPDNFTVTDRVVFSPGQRASCTAFSKFLTGRSFSISSGAPPPRGFLWQTPTGATNDLTSSDAILTDPSLHDKVFTASGKFHTTNDCVLPNTPSLNYWTKGDGLDLSNLIEIDGKDLGRGVIKGMCIALVNIFG